MISYRFANNSNTNNLHVSAFLSLHPIGTYFYPCFTCKKKVAFQAKVVYCVASQCHCSWLSCHTVHFSHTALMTTTSTSTTLSALKGFLQNLKRLLILKPFRLWMCEMIDLFKGQITKTRVKFVVKFKLHFVNKFRTTLYTLSAVTSIALEKIKVCTQRVGDFNRCLSGKLYQPLCGEENHKQVFSCNLLGVFTHGALQVGYAGKSNKPQTVLLTRF